MQKLRACRLGPLLSAHDLAERAGIEHKTLIDLEHGRRTPTFRTMRGSCDALGVEPADVTAFAAALEHKRDGSA